MSELKPKLSLAKDLLDSSKSMTVDQARFLVDTYYQIQDARIRASAQVRALVSSEEPHSLLDWVGDVNAELENKIKRTLEIYAKHNPVGQWSLGITGIGPVIAAGLLAHIDITQAPTVGHIWRYAGQDPTCKWEKGQKRPWNAGLKTLCWKIGESFVKVSGNKKDIYGQHYLRRKEQEIIKNENLEFKDQADIKATKVGKTTDAYKSYSIGKLPKAHIHARAKRYAVKLFLAHWHEVAYREHYKAEPPLPYPIAHLGHAHHIKAA
jgi:hypothetical protein